MAAAAEHAQVGGVVGRTTAVVDLLARGATDHAQTAVALPHLVADVVGHVAGGFVVTVAQGVRPLDSKRVRDVGWQLVTVLERHRARVPNVLRLVVAADAAVMRLAAARWTKALTTGGARHPDHPGRAPASHPRRGTARRASP